MDDPAGAPRDAGGTIHSIGVVGLGKMGGPISRRWVEAGYRVCGHDGNPEAARTAASWGVEVLPDARSVASSSQVSLVLVGFDDQARSVVRDPETGLLAGAGTGHVILIGSTVAPDLSVELGQSAREVGVHVLDAPLCRGEGPAADGTLLVMAGGDAEIFDQVRPVLTHIASDIHLLGGLGAGQVGKMLNNYLLWLTIVGNYEAMTLAHRTGLDLESLRTALLQSSGANWALETWDRPRPMPWAEKDMFILSRCADQHGVSMPTAEHVAGAIAELKSAKKNWLGGTGSRRSMADFVERDESTTDPSAP